MPPARRSWPRSSRPDSKRSRIGRAPRATHIPSSRIGWDDRLVTPISFSTQSRRLRPMSKWADKVAQVCVCSRSRRVAAGLCRRRRAGLLAIIGAVWGWAQIAAGRNATDSLLPGAALVLSPHHDDETVGCGFLIAEKFPAGIRSQCRGHRRLPGQAFAVAVTGS